MKKRIIIAIMLIVSIVVGSVCVYNKVSKQKIETNNIVNKKNKEEIKSDLIEDENDKNDIETTASNNDEEKQSEVIVEESKPSNKKSNHNPTSNSNNNNQVVENKTPVVSQPVQNTEPVVENSTPPTPVTPSCTPKKFINSWFVGEFRSQQACLDAGEKYMFDYSVSCPYLDDDCGTTYWMLQLIDRNGNIVDYHTLN